MSLWRHQNCRKNSKAPSPQSTHFILLCNGYVARQRGCTNDGSKVPTRYMYLSVRSVGRSVGGHLRNSGLPMLDISNCYVNFVFMIINYLACITLFLRLIILKIFALQSTLYVRCTCIEKFRLMPLHISWKINSQINEK